MSLPGIYPPFVGFAGVVVLPPDGTDPTQKFTLELKVFKAELELIEPVASFEVILQKAQLTMQDTHAVLEVCNK